MYRIDGYRSNVPLYSMFVDGAGGVEGELGHAERNRQARRVGAGRERRRMDEHDRLAPLELLEQWIERRVTQIAVALAGVKHDAVEPQTVVGVFELIEGRIDVRQRHRGEAAEMLGVVAQDVRDELVRLSRELHREPGVAAPVHAGRRRRHRGIDAHGAHHVVGLLQAPRRDLRASRPRDVQTVQCRDEVRRQDVVVYVNAFRLGIHVLTLAPARFAHPREHP